MKVLIESNLHLNKARKNKNDEFYTQIEDIEKEITDDYEKFFINKTIYCNCDNLDSKFVIFFLANFNRFKLKKLIATGLSGFKLEVQKIDNYSYSEIEKLLKSKFFNITKLLEDDNYEAGDFRSSQCIELLKESDIVITNPPFSLFRDYIDTLFYFNKKFIIIGHLLSCTYKQIFPLIANNSIKVRNVVKSFNTSKGIKHIEAIWLTNLNLRYNKPFLQLSKSYNKKDYPKLDNYNAININRYTDIPDNYYGIIAVPISFIEHYNPNQFKILSLIGKYNYKKYRTKIYSNSIVKKFGARINMSSMIKENGKLKFLFPRVLIKKI